MICECMTMCLCDLQLICDVIAVCNMQPPEFNFVKFSDLESTLDNILYYQNSPVLNFDTLPVKYLRMTS